MADERSGSTTIVTLLAGILILLLLIVGAQGWQAVRGVSVKSQSWEYLIDGTEDEKLQSRLQALGAAGWELVFARRATTERGGTTTGIYEMIFRRPTGTSASIGSGLELPIPPK
jgi:hypothetical protein